MYSILTATYNRANDLEILYKSLLKNRKHEFTWLIMDDGSVDNTKDIVDEFIKENIINIKYHHQNNKGKIVAINNLIQYVDTKYLIECDSDDYITDDFFDVIKKNIKKLDDTVYALAFPRMDENGKFTSITVENKTTLFHLHNKYDYSGELALVFKTQVRKQHLHEPVNNEKFTTEAKLYNKLDKIYGGVYYINTPIMVCEYQETGYTKNISKLFINYPYGHYKYFIEMFNFNLWTIKLSKRLYIIKHVILFSKLTNRNLLDLLFEVKGIFNRLLIFILYIPGRHKSKKFIKDNKII